MSLEHRRPVADAGEPDIGFQAAFGFYLGLIAGGLAALVGLAADVTTATLLGIFPTVVTAVTVGGHVLAKRSHGLPERIGRRRRLRLACYLPAVGFATAAIAPGVVPLGTDGRYYVVTGLLVAVLGMTAFGLERLCRNRFVKAITADEPIVTWTYRPAGLVSHGGTVTVLVTFGAMGLSTSVAIGSPIGLLWIVFGVIVVLGGALADDDAGKKYYGSRYSLDVDSNAEYGELRAHERGIRRDQGRSRKLVPWEEISDIRLTDEELVLERRWLDIRCDRDAIDDPEAVLEDVERARSRANAKTVH